MSKIKVITLSTILHNQIPLKSLPKNKILLALVCCTCSLSQNFNKLYVIVNNELYKNQICKIA